MIIRSTWATTSKKKVASKKSEPIKEVVRKPVVKVEETAPQKEEKATREEQTI